MEKQHAQRILLESSGNKAVADRVKVVASNGGMPLMLSENDRVLGVVELQDIIKPGVQERFTRLRSA